MLNKKNQATLIWAILTICLFVFLPLAVSAQGTLWSNPQGISLNIIGGGTVRTAVTTIINLALTVAGLIAVAFLIYGGFRYITSGGNEEIAEGAKKTIQNSIIGLIVIILSLTIVVVITNALVNRTV